MLYHGNGYIINLNKINFVRPARVNNGETMVHYVHFRFCNGDKHEVECENLKVAEKIINSIGQSIRGKK